MFTKGKIHTEILKISAIFPEIYFPIKSYKIQKNLNSNKLKKIIHEKIDLLKRHKRRFTPDIIQLKKFNSNYINIDSSKNTYQNNHKSSQLTNSFHGKSLFYKNACSKSQDKPIKINLVSQKFKIADDFNEKNSNQFLNEKDECLREEILSDEIEDEEFIHLYAKKEKENIFNLSSIKKSKINCNLNGNQIKRKIVEMNLIEDHK